MFLTVPLVAWAQGDGMLQTGAAKREVVSDDSIVSMRELHRLHREERWIRGPLMRRDMGNGRKAVIGLRSNLLRWLTFTPELGLVVHCGPRVDMQFNAAWTSMTVSDRYQKRYALWILSPEVRYYLGAHERYYLGVQGEMSYRDIRLSNHKKGRRGHVYGGGLVGGYQFMLSRHTSLDLHLGVGYNAGKMTYFGDVVDVIVDDNGQELPATGNEHRFGVNHLGVSLVWDIW